MKLAISEPMTDRDDVHALIHALCDADPESTYSYETQTTPAMVNDDGSTLIDAVEVFTIYQQTRQLDSDRFAWASAFVQGWIAAGRKPEFCTCEKSGSCDGEGDTCDCDDQCDYCFEMCGTCQTLQRPTSFGHCVRCEQITNERV